MRTMHMDDQRMSVATHSERRMEKVPRSITFTIDVLFFSFFQLFMLMLFTIFIVFLVTYGPSMIVKIVSGLGLGGAMIKLDIITV